MLGGTSSIELAGSLGLALGMAIFLGLTFEGIYKLEERGSPGGIRSFPMLTTVGAVLFLLQPQGLLPFSIGLAAVALWQYAHFAREPPRIGRPICAREYVLYEGRRDRPFGSALAQGRRACHACSFVRGGARRVGARRSQPRRLRRHASRRRNVEAAYRASGGRSVLVSAGWRFGLRGGIGRVVPGVVVPFAGFDRIQHETGADGADIAQ